MREYFPALSVFFLIGAGGGRPIAASSQWHVRRTPHFDLRCAAALPPAGLELELEKLHSRLRLELGMIAPWLSEKRIRVYLYSDAKAYHDGRFAPPAWSNGISISNLYILATYLQPDRAKLIRVLSHEATHLLFEGYFREGRPGRSIHASGMLVSSSPHEPPLWLDEGLAMLMEDPVSFTSDDEKSNVWLEAMRNRRDYLPLPQFLAAGPAQQKTPDQVAAWYLQAYSLTRYLFRGHPVGPFKTFCALLRGGTPLEAALRRSYGYPSLPAFEADWRSWLHLPAADPLQNFSMKFTPLDFSSPTFRAH